MSDSAIQREQPPLPFRLSPRAGLEIGFWFIIVAFIYYVFHLHGNTMELDRAGTSLFRWMKLRWSGDMAYGAVLPFVSLGVLWLQRKKLAAAVRRPAWSGFWFVALALCLHWFGVQGQLPRISMVALMLLLWAMPFFIYGWDFAKYLIFPCSYLFLSVPLNFLDSMTSPLRIFASWLAATILNGLGLQVHQIGAGLYSDAGNPFAFNVAPECSGLRSLFAMTALMAVYAWYTQKTLPRKWFFFLCSVPVAIIANVFRIILVVLVAAMLGQDAAMGLWHDYSGYPIFIFGILLMLGLERLMNVNYRNLWRSFKNLILPPASS